VLSYQFNQSNFEIKWFKLKPKRIFIFVEWLDRMNVFELKTFGGKPQIHNELNREIKSYLTFETEKYFFCFIYE
jgi:hypothetical protein